MGDFCLILLKEVLLVVTDGLSGIEESIHSVYPNAQFQQCCVHVSRNIAHKVRVRDRKEICEDFKLVYQANSKEEALDHIDFMTRKWKKQYPRVVNLLLNPALLTFYNFPHTIRRIIYSTNLIEGFNKQLKRYTRRKEQFPNEESLERFLVSQFNHKICQIKRDKTFHLRNSKKLLMVFGNLVIF